jgi:hypothetical protein
MPSFGESHFIIVNRRVGIASVTDVLPSRAVFPRLQIQLGVSLHEDPNETFERDRPVKGFELRGLAGELSLQDGTALGTVAWNGPHRFVRSSTYPNQSPVPLTCDLDPSRVARIEDARAGKEAVFTLALWPTIVDSRGHLDATLDVIRLTVPRDRWIAVLGGFQHTKFELVEIPYPSLDEPDFEASVSHLRDALGRVNAGDYDEAVAASRRAIESLANTLNVGHKGPDLTAALTAPTDAKRGEAYAGIVVRLKALGNITIHRRTAAPKYTRVEAQFVVGTTAHALALVARLIRR